MLVKPKGINREISYVSIIDSYSRESEVHPITAKYKYPRIIRELEARVCKVNSKGIKRLISNNNSTLTSNDF